MSDGVSRRGFLRAAGAGAAGLAATGQAAAQEDGGGGGTTHTVDMTDSLVYDPAELTVAPGDTVEWVTVGSIPHTVTAYEDQIPDGAEYFASGGFGGEQAAVADQSGGLVAQGESYSHTFETTGTYEYYCIPHEQAGMKGSVTVEEPGSGPTRPTLPDSAKTLGVATMTGMVAVLGLAYAFLKYGGSPPPEE